MTKRPRRPRIKRVVLAKKKQFAKRFGEVLLAFCCKTKTIIENNIPKL